METTRTGPAGSMTPARRGRGAGLVRVLLVLATAVGLVAGSSSQAAQAATGDPLGKVTVPSSVIGSLDSASPAERARMVGNTIPTDANRLPNGQVTAPKVPASAPVGALSKGGAAFAAVTGMQVGWQIGSGVASLFGLDSAGALSSVLGLNPAPGYAPNSDALDSGLPAGWTSAPGPWAQRTYINCGTYCGSYYEGTRWWGGPLAAPAFGQPVDSTATATVEYFIDWSTPAADGQGGNFAQSVWVDVMVTKNGTGTPTRCLRLQGNSFPSEANPAKPRRWELSGTPPAVWKATRGDGTVGMWNESTYTFDHLAAVDVSQQVIARWYPEGHDLRPEPVTGNPERKWEVRYSCTTGVGGVTQSAAFRESDAQWPQVPAATCSAGEVDSLELWQVTPAAPDMDVLVDSWAASAPVTDWRTAFPECQTTACTLELLRVDQGTALSCFAQPEACVDWWTTSEPTRSERFECRYAGTVVPLGECKVYSPTFNVATNTPVQTSTGTVPASAVGPRADPATGDPVPSDGTAPAPGTGTGGQPDGCPPPFNLQSVVTGYWVYKGVQCALAWAFVPTKTGAAVDELTATAQAATPWPQVASVVGWFDPPSGAGSQCLVLTLRSVPLVGGDAPVFDSCSDAPFVVWLREHRWLTGIALWSALVFPLVWWAWREYAPGSKGVA